MLKLSYINNVANSQQNVVLRIMMSFGNPTLFDTIWKRKFRILTRFLVIFNHIVTWFPTKKSMDVIGQQYGIHRNLVSKINKGQAYVIKNFSYPAR